MLKSKLVKQSIEYNYSCIMRGRVYGTNSGIIYESFCDTLKWDRDKVNQFGRQGAPLYAENCDADRKLAVWFISNPKFYTTEIFEKNHINFIKNNGDEIVEKVAPFIGSSRDTGRITFVKINRGYEFFGVYKLVQNGTTRIYKRISDIYPMK